MKYDLYSELKGLMGKYGLSEPLLTQQECMIMQERLKMRPGFIENEEELEEKELGNGKKFIVEIGYNKSEKRKYTVFNCKDGEKKITFSRMESEKGEIRDAFYTSFIGEDGSLYECMIENGNLRISYGIIPDEEVFLKNPNLVEIFSRMAENPEKFCREQLERAQNKQITR